MDKRADAKGEIGDRKSRGDSLGVNGRRALGRAGKGSREFGERADSSEQGQQYDDHGGMHDMLPEVFLAPQKTQEEQSASNVGGDQGGWMDGSGEEEGGQAQSNIGGGKFQSHGWHKFVTSLTHPMGK